MGRDVVAVLPVFEGAAELGVAKMVVPDEVGDLGVPGDADGGEGEGAEGERQACAGACGDASLGRGGGRSRGRRGEGGLFDTGLLPGGHEAGKVLGVREEGEDELGGEGEPLLGVEGVAHGEKFSDVGSTLSDAVSTM